MNFCALFHVDFTLYKVYNTTIVKNSKPHGRAIMDMIKEIERYTEILKGTFTDPEERKYWEDKLKEAYIKQEAYKNNSKKKWR